MKKYDTAFIKAYIEKHHPELKSVACGMKEDWSWTADVVWEDGKFVSEFNWNSKSIEVAGITGSIWATPVMWVEFKDGHTEDIPCFFD